MSERQSSNTAWGVMVLRAAHQLVDDPPRILDDPIAVQLLDPDTRQRIVLPGLRVSTPEARTLRAHVVIRSRLAEDCLAAAAAGGIRQYLILGAGYDTFAYRQPGWAAGLRVFEVDHPASQDAKRRRLTQCGIAAPANLTWAPIDFEIDTLASGLARAGFDLRVPTFVSCLGVLMYLTLDAAYGVFDFVGTLPPSSEIVATFHSVRRDAPSTESPLGQSAAAAGEPWLSWFDPFELEDALIQRGFAHVELIANAELEVRYALKRRDGLAPGRGISTVRAVV